MAFDTLPALPPFAAFGGLNDVRTEFFLGSLGWTDVTPYVQETAQQQAGRGKPDETTTATPSTLALTLNNSDGRFYDGNPSGPYYGNFGRNTPVRISVPEGATYLRIRDDTTSYCSTPSASALNPAASTDIQMDVTLDNWADSVFLAGKWAETGNERSWALLTLNGTLQWVLSQNGTSAVTYGSNTPLPPPLVRRQSVRVVYNSATGNATLYTGPPGLPSNFLTGQNAGFEGGIGTWIASANTSIADSAAQAHSGSDSLALTSLAAGNIGASPTGTLAQFLPVVPGQLVNGSSWHRAAVSPRTCQLGCNFYQANGTFITSITSSATITDSTSAWTQLVDAGDMIAPPLAAWAQLYVNVNATGAASEVHYIDDIAIYAFNWVQVGSQTGAAGAIFASTAPIQLGYLTNAPGLNSQVGMSGKVHAFQMLSWPMGPQVASPDFTAEPAGTTSFNDSQANTWTNSGTAVIINRHYTFWGETAAMPTNWNAKGTSVVVALQGGGLLRRLSQSASQEPLQSVLRRAWPKLPNLVAYWPCEDGNSQGFSFATSAAPTSFAPGIPGVSIGTYAGQAPPQFASNSNFQASLSLPSTNGAIWNFSLPGNRANDTANTLRFLLQIPAGGESAATSPTTVTILEFHTTGTMAKAQLYYTQNPVGGGGGSIGLRGFNAAGTSLFDSNAFGGELDGQALWVSLEFQTSGASVQWAFLYEIIGQTFVELPAVSTFTGTIGNGTTIIVNPQALLTNTAVGHITYQQVQHDMGAGEFAQVINAMIGEAAAVRFKRLCNEQGIPWRGRGLLTDSQAMGAQTPTDIISLLQECIDADRGMYWEPAHVMAIGYRTLASLLNQPPLVLPYNSQQVAALMSSNEDDQYTINDAIVVNTYTGGQAEVAVTTGPLSNQAPPNGVGPYEAQPQINVANDWQTSDEAGWITWVGTSPDLRYPSVPFHMSRIQTAALFSGLQELDTGDRLQITDCPVWLPPDSDTISQGGVDVLVANQQTTLNVKTYELAITGVPNTPYLTAVADDPVHGRADAVNSTLDTGISSSATTMIVDSPAPGVGSGSVVPADVWTTNGADCPLDVGVGGEQITISGIRGPGVTNVGSDTANPPQIAITPNSSASVIYGAVHNPSAATAFTANAATTFSQNTTDATNTRTYGTFRSTATTTGGTPVTVGGSAPATACMIATAEVITNGTLTEDGTSPAAVSTFTAKTISTASFTPPAGSLLLAMVAANGTGGIGQSIGGGPTGTVWQLIAQDGNNRVTVWAGRVPAATAAATVTATASGGASANGIALTVKVLDNAAAGPGSQVFFISARSQNGVVKAQVTGTGVALYTTPATGL